MRSIRHVVILYYAVVSCAFDTSGHYCHTLLHTLHLYYILCFAITIPTTKTHFTFLIFIKPSSLYIQFYFFVCFSF
ncbi:hypothetical protein L1987_34291 [Smallanthus sonchifolius]|uniref:Uncharacterized protein n=1 Tax=Smallanthus sonchifolius TaxID=185202 RepID=A0ACB9HU86_9ASTR|nr:hypothetical protein L1987_34291 [Smallanthus sonchifolius]